MAKGKVHCFSCDTEFPITEQEGQRLLQQTKDIFYVPVCGNCNAPGWGGTMFVGSSVKSPLPFAISFRIGTGRT